MIAKILVTGGSGFIGTNLINHFIRANYDIINIDKVKPKIVSQLKFWKECDINDFNTFKQFVLDFQPTYIVHLAARTDLEGKNIEDYKTNTLGVQNLMSIVKELSSLKKIVLTSSMLICKSGYYPKNQLDFKPDTIYGESKVLTEKKVWNNKPNCDWSIIRPTSIWGPWFGVPYKSFFDMIISRKYFHIGNKGCTKTYGYVGNAVFQIEKILFSNTLNNTNKVFYIGDNPATNIEEWGNEIATELGIKILKLPLIFIKLLAYFGDVLKLVKINFPMTSFRLKNMTTNNIIDLKNTYSLAKELPFTRKDGIKITLKWINQIDK